LVALSSERAGTFVWQTYCAAGEVHDNHDQQFDGNPKCARRDDSRRAHSERRRQYNTVQFHIIKKVWRLFRHFFQQPHHGMEWVNCTRLLPCAGPRGGNKHAVQRLRNLRCQCHRPTISRDPHGHNLSHDNGLSARQFTRGDNSRHILCFHVGWLAICGHSGSQPGRRCCDCRKYAVGACACAHLG
jgi:hypothetical protein